MKKFISIALSVMLFFGLIPQRGKVFAGDTSKISCEKSSQFWKVCTVIEGIMLTGGIGYIGYQHYLKQSKYNDLIKIKQSTSIRMGDTSPIPIIDKILKYDIPRALNGEAAVCSDDVDCIFELVFRRRSVYNRTERVIANEQKLCTYRATFNMVCLGEQTMTIRQFVDMLNDIREMY